VPVVAASSASGGHRSAAIGRRRTDAAEGDAATGDQARQDRGERVGQTSMAHVYAGGDVVRGGSTVILAMRDGRARPSDRQGAAGRQGAGGAGAGRGAGVNLVLDKRQLGPKCSNWKCRRRAFRSAGKRPVHHSPALTTSERIPLTLVSSNAERQSVTLVIQAIGNTTKRPWRWSRARAWRTSWAAGRSGVDVRRKARGVHGGGVGWRSAAVAKAFRSTATT